MLIHLFINDNTLIINLQNFLIEIIHLPFLELSFLEISRWELEVGQPPVYRTWPDCTDVQDGLALYTGGRG